MSLVKLFALVFNTLASMVTRRLGLGGSSGVNGDQQDGGSFTTKAASKDKPGMSGPIWELSFSRRTR
jgi:hypothetical protein